NGAVSLAGRAAIVPMDIEQLLLQGFAGDDAFHVSGPQPYAEITLSGGDPSDADSATFAGNAAFPLLLETNLEMLHVSGGGVALARLESIKSLTLINGGAPIGIAGSTGPDEFRVTPTGVNTAEI